MCQKTIKQTLSCTKKELILIFQSDLKKYMNHVLNIRNQYKKVNLIKKELSETEVLIHMDFSQNFERKYHRAVQSAHFGASKEQLSLYTVVVHIRSPNSGNCQSSDEENKVSTISFCTVTDNLRHDPPAICAHLDPVLLFVREKIPNLKTVHFLSDGPTTQYRNKKMFYLMGQYLASELKVDYLQWHYFESGHGKGAPDGIGGCLKRMADRISSLSEDITTCEDFVRILRNQCPGIKIMDVDNSKIDKLERSIPTDLSTLKGTMRVHEITWKKSDKYILQAKSLSCLTCQLSVSCPHFHVGTVNLENTCSDNYILLLLICF